MKVEHNPEKGCAECPFRGVEFSRFCDEPADADDVCNAAERRGTGYSDGPGAPEWCPLRAGPIVVEPTPATRIATTRAHPKSTSMEGFRGVLVRKAGA